MSIFAINHLCREVLRDHTFRAAMKANPAKALAPLDLTEEERRVLDLARPHLIQAHANAALREIFTGKEAFQPILRPDHTNSLPGALVVITHWPLHTDVYRIEANVTD